MLLSHTVNRPRVLHYHRRRVPQARNLAVPEKARVYFVDDLRHFSSHYLLRYDSAPCFIIDTTACSTACSGNLSPQYGMTIAYLLNRLIQ